MGDTASNNHRPPPLPMKFSVVFSIFASLVFASPIPEADANAAAEAEPCPPDYYRGRREAEADPNADPEADPRRRCIRLGFM